MRRNRPINRGGSMGRVNMSGGPLITEHLKDIDLELELLKRKREMLEHQHNILQPLKKSNQRSYNQQPYMYNDNGGQSSSDCDFSHLYNDGPQNYRRPPIVKKRPSETIWQNDSFPKRSAGYGQRGHGYSVPSLSQNQRSFTANQPKRGLPSKSGQGRQSIAQKITNYKKQASEKKIAPNKVTKPKTSAPPNKIAAQPMAERNNLVAVAMKSVAESVFRDREAFRLLPDKEPSKQITGRMEMALGAILRDVREIYAGSQNEEILRTVPLQRVIKQAIRDRVRTAMLGKVVGATQEVITEYRDMFPKETDNDIVNEALKTVGFEPNKDKKSLTPIGTANKTDPIKGKRPDDHFKANMFKLLNCHLTEMFNKIEEIYNPPNENQSNLPEMDITEDNLKEKEEPTEMKVENDTATPAAAIETPDAVPAEETKVVEEPGETPAPMEVDDNATPAATKEVETTAEAAAPKEDEAAVPKEAEAATLASEAEEAAAKLGAVNPNEYKRMLPRLLRKYIPVIIKLMNLNKMYKQAVDDLITSTRAKYVSYGKGDNTDETSTSEIKDNTPGAQSTPKKSQYPLPYYVKVMGKPQLPKKKVMQPFLEAFSPKSIKKHRTIHNLLFIGFTEKKYFDAIVEANGTVIGRSTLSIRVCDNSNEKQEDNLNSSTDTTAQNADGQKSAEDLIGSDLDVQITDLLTTINSEEIAAENPECKEGDEAIENAEVTGACDDKVEATTAEEGKETVQESENNDPAETENQNGVDTVAPNENAEIENKEVNEEKADKVSELKSAAPEPTSTPQTRASTRLANAPATPGSIRTRRASKLQNN